MKAKRKYENYMVGNTPLEGPFRDASSFNKSLMGDKWLVSEALWFSPHVLCARDYRAQLFSPILPRPLAVSWGHAASFGNNT